jgi:hypothetical protein
MEPFPERTLIFATRTTLSRRGDSDRDHDLGDITGKLVVLNRDVFHPSFSLKLRTLRGRHFM